jgi:hypothetical protein
MVQQPKKHRCAVLTRRLGGQVREVRYMARRRAALGLTGGTLVNVVVDLIDVVVRQVIDGDAAVLAETRQRRIVRGPLELVAQGRHAEDLSVGVFDIVALAENDARSFARGAVNGGNFVHT